MLARALRAAAAQLVRRRRAVGARRLRHASSSSSAPPLPALQLAGDGRLPVLLVPGLLCDARVFEAQARALRAHRYDPHIVDTLRCGTSLAAFASAVIDIAPPKFALAGISMGGYIAFEVFQQLQARGQSDRMSHLGLISTSAASASPHYVAQRATFVEWARGGRFAEVVGECRKLMFSERRSAWDAVYDAMAAAVGPETYERQQKAVSARADHTELLKRIDTHSVLFVVPERDGSIDSKLQREQAATIHHNGHYGAAAGYHRHAHDNRTHHAQHSKTHAAPPRHGTMHTVVVPHAGHLVTIEQPDVVNAALLAWLRDA